MELPSSTWANDCPDVASPGKACKLKGQECATKVAESPRTVFAPWTGSMHHPATTAPPSAAPAAALLLLHASHTRTFAVARTDSLGALHVRARRRSRRLKLGATSELRRGTAPAHKRTVGPRSGRVDRPCPPERCADALAVALILLTRELASWRSHLPDVMAQSTAWQRQTSGIRDQTAQLSPKIDAALAVTHDIVAETARVRREIPPMLAGDRASTPDAERDSAACRRRPPAHRWHGADDSRGTQDRE